MDRHYPRIIITKTVQITGVHQSVTLQGAMENQLDASTAMQWGILQGTVRVRKDKRKHEGEMYRLIHLEVKPVWLLLSLEHRLQPKKFHRL